MAENQNVQNDNEATVVVFGGLILIGLGLFINFITIGVLGEDIGHFSLWDLISSGIEDLKGPAMIIVAGMVAIIFSTAIKPTTKSAAIVSSLIASIATVVGGYTLIQIFASSVIEVSMYWGMIPIGIVYICGIDGFIGFFRALNMQEGQQVQAPVQQVQVKQPVQSVSVSAPAKNPEPVKAQKMAAIRSMSPQHNGMMVAIHSAPITIGRDPSVCKLIYSPNTVGISGKHCTISFDESEGDFIVTDLNSSYGTYINGSQRIQPGVPTRIKPGTSLCIGDPGNVVKLELM